MERHHTLPWLRQCPRPAPRTRTVHHPATGRRNADLRSAAEAMLAEMAFAYHLTHRVKAALLEEKASPTALV